jgi:hypothetical protein
MARLTFRCNEGILYPSKGFEGFPISNRFSCFDGKKSYQIGIPIHWGFRGLAEDAGRTAHTPTYLLSPTVIDPNAFAPEFEGFVVKVEGAWKIAVSG